MHLVQYVEKAEVKIEIPPPPPPSLQAVTLLLTSWLPPHD